MKINNLIIKIKSNNQQKKYDISDNISGKIKKHIFNI